MLNGPTHASAFVYLQFVSACYFIRTLTRFQHIETVDFLEHKMNLNRHYSLQRLFMWAICPSTRLRSKFMSYSLGLVKSRRLSWDWISTAKHLVAFALLRTYLFIISQKSELKYLIICHLKSFVDLFSPPLIFI